uniref:CSON003496 protein n=1 Tax=Culicoides sonorensis TaxID=179676 RepID=A0A336LSQ4_CULSO
MVDEIIEAVKMRDRLHSTYPIIVLHRVGKRVLLVFFKKWQQSDPDRLVKYREPTNVRFITSNLTAIWRS